ncbi:MAG: plastocyanin/azurin family copper-binding protein [Pseudomonadota bacterium]
MNTIYKLSAAAVLAAGLSAPATAQNADADCPEDFDTLPGCDMSPMDHPDFPNNLSSHQSAAEPASTAEAEADAAAKAEAEAAAQAEAEAAEAAEAEAAAAAKAEEEAAAAKAEEEAAAAAATKAAEEEAAAAAAKAEAEAAAKAEAEAAAKAEAEAAAKAEAEAAAAAEAEAAAAAAAPETEPETHVVEARGVKFAPMVTFINPGDTVAWERMASHNVETIDEMVPEGQPKVKTELGEEYFTTFDTVGIVVYKCTPHWGARMGGIIVVGTPDDAGAIIDAYMASTDSNKSNLPARGLLKKLRQELDAKGML